MPYAAPPPISKVALTTNSTSTAKSRSLEHFGSHEAGIGEVLGWSKSSKSDEGSSGRLSSSASSASLLTLVPSPERANTPEGRPKGVPMAISKALTVEDGQNCSSPPNFTLSNMVNTLNSSSSKQPIDIPRPAINVLPSSSTPPVSSSNEFFTDDEGSYFNTPLVRKKSGELVKSSLKLSSLNRCASMPTTPLSSKSVHFDSHLEHVRTFSHAEKPSSISATTSPLVDGRPEMYNYGAYPTFAWNSSDEEVSESDEDQDNYYQVGLRNEKWSIKLLNFPTAPSSTNNSSNGMVFVERVLLSTDNTSLIGHIAVLNVSYAKYVAVKFTLDYWKTITQVQAEYNDDIRRKERLANYDRFTFVIDLRSLSRQVLRSNPLLFCVFYKPREGEEYWDNNFNQNYRVDFNHDSRSTNRNNKTRPIQNRATPTIKRELDLNQPFPVDQQIQSALKHHNPNNNINTNQFNGPLNQMDSYHRELSRSLQERFQTLDGSTSDEDEDIEPILVKQPAARNFSSRYDFTASIHAARSFKDENYTLDTPKAPTKSNSHHFSTTHQTHRRTSSSPVSFAPLTTTMTPAGILQASSNTDVQPSPKAPNPPEVISPLEKSRPPVNSSLYQDLINSYCFFSSSGTSTSSPSGPKGGLKKSKSSKTRLVTKSPTMATSIPSESGTSTSESTMVSASSTSMSESDSKSESLSESMSDDASPEVSEVDGTPRLYPWSRQVHV
ncbi:hypothetical protein NADFUDRAFT_84544 [Nadsonia fulvescens var. elongata DSM 6958]|uniref:CBM21 domain-containing protein n=1 Tax=Nadsonia fulvescens var. elongata DSM 6958 TaxID=857566 RepID=A0A1E3PCG6_9ASCO|nr:hypothetical protein NADFUDRAFT_84544 [Nadsonia fulvescens var. elongata DSM 6958]